MIAKSNFMKLFPHFFLICLSFRSHV
jgi:hypothetical protein